MSPHNATLLCMNGNPLNKKYAAIAAQIRTIAQEYANRNILDYLRGIPYNFEFWVYSYVRT